MSEKVQTFRDVAATASRALSSGGRRTSLTSAAWDIAGKCKFPVSREIFGRSPDSGHAAVFRIDLEVRCRKCDNCRLQRQFLWASRARSETAAAYRTWFGTLTCTVAVHNWSLAVARDKEARQGVDLDSLSYGEQFNCRRQVISKEVTKYIKRLRKATGSPFVYLAVCEVHKSGLPHYHMLIHERDPVRRVAWDQLDRLWHFGFTKWNLINEGDNADYVCKYLSKTTRARVRASRGYGNHLPSWMVVEMNEKKENVILRPTK